MGVPRRQMHRQDRTGLVLSERTAGRAALYEFTIRLNRSVICGFGVVCANARAIAVAVRGKEPVTRQEVGI